MNRRTFAIGLPLLLGTFLCPACARSAAASEGCRLRRAAAGNDDDLPKLLASSGDIELDRLVHNEATTLNALFEVNPSTGFYDDTSSPNAFAMSEQYNKSKPDGTVLIGIELARSVAAQAKSMLPLIGIMAHEWGHLLQFKSGYTNDWGVRYELTADYMAGWYLFRTRAHEKSLKTTISGIFSDIGDTDFSNSDHHGSPKQRSRILLLGAGEIWHEGGGQISEPPVTASEAFKAAQQAIQ